MNEEALLFGIRDANYHAEGIRCLRLFQLESSYFAKLRADVERLCRTERGSDVTDQHHVTNWTRPRGEVSQFSLLNTSGRYDDFSSDHVVTCLGKQFHGAATYSQLAQFVSAFPHCVNFRVNFMGPHSRLAEHEEHSVIRTTTGSIGIRLRLHLPLTTNPSAELKLDGSVYHLEEGTVYFVNHGCVHSACNGGDQSRIHLVWDMLLTEQAFAFLFNNHSCPPGFLPVPSPESAFSSSRNERVGAYVKLPPLVTRAEADVVAFCQIQ